MNDLVTMDRISDPQVSPDGETVAFTGFDDRYQGYQVVGLYLMNRDGSVREPRR